MFKNLEAEMKRASIDREDLANATNRSYSSILNKMSGKSPFTIEEVWEIREKLFPGLTIDYLFDPNVGKEAE